jgi:hypothetical protein
VTNFKKSIWTVCHLKPVLTHSLQQYRYDASANHHGHHSRLIKSITAEWALWVPKFRMWTVR